MSFCLVCCHGGLLYSDSRFWGGFFYFCVGLVQLRTPGREKASILSLQLLEQRDFKLTALATLFPPY